MATKQDVIDQANLAIGLVEGTVDPKTIPVPGLDPSVVSVVSAGIQVGSNISQAFAGLADEFTFGGD